MRLQRRATAAFIKHRRHRLDAAHGHLSQLCARWPVHLAVEDSADCVNRRSSNVRRARFAVEEVVDLTLAFYRRNYIEGLFLSSGRRTRNRATF
jgi:hypothetical protein